MLLSNKMDNKYYDSKVFFACLEGEKNIKELVNILFKEKSEKKEYYQITCPKCKKEFYREEILKKDGKEKFKMPKNNCDTVRKKDLELFKEIRLPHCGKSKSKIFQKGTIIKFIKKEEIPRKIEQSKRYHLSRWVLPKIENRFIIKTTKNRYKFYYEGFFKEIIIKTGYIGAQERGFKVYEELGKSEIICKRFVKEFYTKTYDKYKFKTFEEFIESFIFALGSLKSNEFNPRLRNLRINKEVKKAWWLLYLYTHAYYNKRYGSLKKDMIKSINAFNIQYKISKGKNGMIKHIASAKIYGLK